MMRSQRGFLGDYPRRWGERGFTLAELLVVLLIVAILAIIGVPQYNKTVESSKADDAAATVQMIATTNRMYAIDHGNTYTSGPFTSGSSDLCLAAWSSTACCPGETGCTNNTFSDPCNLIYCRYLARQPFDNKPYIYKSMDGAAAPTTDSCGLGAPVPAVPYVACCKRSAGNYANWGYTVDVNGNTVARNGAPSPPR